MLPELFWRLYCRKSGGGAVLLHQHQQGAPINGGHSVGYKQVGGNIFPTFDVGADEFHSVGRHGIDAGHGTFDAVDGYAGSFQVQVGALKHTDFGSSEAVAVGDGKDGAVALGFDGVEKAVHFLLGEEGYGAVLFSFRVV